MIELPMELKDLKWQFEGSYRCRCRMCKKVIPDGLTFGMTEVSKFKTIREGAAVKIPKFGGEPVCLHHPGVLEYVREVMGKIEGKQPISAEVLERQVR